MSADETVIYHLSDLGLMHSVLNEVLNGFALDDFDTVIGMTRSQCQRLFTNLHDSAESMSFDLDLPRTIVFSNALRETLRELGPEEFQTRVGYDFETGQQILGQLDQFIAANQHG